MEPGRKKTPAETDTGAEEKAEELKIEAAPPEQTQSEPEPLESEPPSTPKEMVQPTAEKVEEKVEEKSS